MRRFFDTSYLLDMTVDELNKITDKPFICEQTLEEIENIKSSGKKDDSTKAKARRIARFLNTHEDVFEFIENVGGIFSFNENSIDATHLNTPDNKICASAVYAQTLLPEDENLVFYTKDACCRLIAKEKYGLTVAPYEDGEEKIYKGYRIISGNTEEINNLMQSYMDDNYSDWNTNEYLIIQEDGAQEREMRFDGERFVSLKLPPSKYIKGKNALQRCALDMLNNPDITICAILGGYGSGKTMLTMQMAMYAVCEKGFQSQIIGIRSPIGEGVEVGWLPGDFNDKTGSFFKPLEQQLNGGEFELEAMKQKGVLRVEIPFYLKGQTLNGVVLVDEAEDLSRRELRLVGTRIGENSRIFLNGDYKQSIVSGDYNDNALLQMCNEFKGNKKFGCIYLEEDVRSTTSKMFSKLWS